MESGRRNNTSSHYVYENKFFFEEFYSPKSTHRWAERNSLLIYYLCVSYVILIFGLQRLMKNRRNGYSLNGYLIFWNLSLTVYNAVYFLRTLPEWRHALFNNGLYYAVCDSRNYLGDSNAVMDFWSFSFTVSKVVEFGDTLFIVLRKRPLIFLHWYHHVLTLCYGWRGYITYNANGRLFGAMNSFVHVFMYLYYALRAAGFRLVAHVSPLITAVQILQMLIGCLLNLYILRVKISDATPCDTTWIDLSISIVMYFTYLFMFCRFFYNSHFAKKHVVTNENSRSSFKND